MRIYDISVPISSETPIYPGDPGVRINQWASLAQNDPANVTLLHFGAHTATHVDAPAHFIAGGSRVEEIPLDVLIGMATVVEIPDDVSVIDAGKLPWLEMSGATRVLFKTRNSSFWSDLAQGFREDFTYIAPDAARALVERGVRLVGMDYLSVEKFQSEDHLTHVTLLEKSVVILEGLDLREVPAGRYELICLPLKIVGASGDGAPARAVLRSLR
ncbi:MAG: hypothetical protein AUG51_02040 [Acidobacteria bacterium 13_1_20CM_3_53_8]|nr:MAG: hypothetical protein AUG51_02040 [Acidobacteria bacterium 13_1_20CM_3_53_8]